MSAFVVVGCAFGDCGKGSIVAALAREVDASLVVRVGGAQAAHYVVLPDGRSHCFSQFGSATFSGARTHLAATMIVEPLALAKEAAHLAATGVADPFALLTIDPDAPVITPFHRALNRLRELLRGADRYGTCGIGIGELAADLAHGQPVLRMRDLLIGDVADEMLWSMRERLARLAADAWSEACYGESQSTWQQAGAVASALKDSPRLWLTHVRDILRGIQPWQIRSAPPLLHSAGHERPIVVECSQGVLLDERWGFPPYHTWLDCTVRPAERALAAIGHTGDVTRVGVLRSFFTRHGPGPFPTEDPSLAPLVADDHNQANQWQGAFRVGHFDAVLAKYAVDCSGGVDLLALTHLDKIQRRGKWPWLMCTRYGPCVGIDPAVTFDEQPAITRFLQDLRVCGRKPHYQGHASVDAFVAAVERHLGVPVGIQSFGATVADKRFTPAFRPAVNSA
jgi:adenylosuccinate synthase